MANHFLTIPTHCKAIKYNRRGDPKDILQYDNRHLVPEFVPKNNVLVRIEAAGLNPVDWKAMKLLPSLWGKKVVAKDYAGTVVRVHGPIEQSRFKPGDNVYGQIEFTEKLRYGSGSLAQYAICPTDTLAKRPPNLGAVELAGITTAAHTALALVEVAANLFLHTWTNRRILICGGSSAVGLMAIPVLKHMGAFIVSTCSSSKFKVVSDRGADELLDCEWLRTDTLLLNCTHSLYSLLFLADQSENFKYSFTASVEKDGRYDLIIDCVNSHDVWLHSPSLLKQGSTYVNIGFDTTQGTLNAIGKNLSYHLLPTWLGGVPTTYKRPAALGTRRMMELLEDLINKGVITPINDSVFEWDQVKDAFIRLQTNRTVGKVIVKVPQNEEE